MYAKFVILRTDTIFCSKNIGSFGLFNLFCDYFYSPKFQMSTESTMSCYRTLRVISLAELQSNIELCFELQVDLNEAVLTEICM